MKKNMLTSFLFLSSFSFVNAQILNLGSLGTLPGINTNTSPTGTVDYLGTYISNDLVFGTYFDRDVVVRTHNIERIRIKNTGLIGIGTNTPTEALHVVGNLKVSANGFFGGALTAGTIKTDSLETKTAGVNLVHKSSSLFQKNLFVSGNTGLGNTNPTERLDITGNLKISGNSFVGGNTFLTGSLNTSGFTTLNGLQVNQNANFEKDLTVIQNTQLNTLTNNGLANFMDNVKVQKNIVVTNNAIVNGNASVAGNTNLAGTLTTSGITTLNILNVNQNANFASNLTVAQNTTLNTSNTTGVATFGSNVDISGNTNINGQIQTSTGVRFPDGKLQTEAVIFPAPGKAELQVMDVKQTMTIGTKKIVVGTTHADNKLAVDGKIVSKEVVVTIDDWADFVFDKEYKLNDLNYVKHFIATNKHLPGVPSKHEVKTEGLNVAEMDATLLKKIEELTLYILKQEERINKLEDQLKQ